MKIAEFLSNERVISSIELVTFPPAPIRFVRMISDDGLVLCLGTEMQTVAERLEIGILKTFDHTVAGGQLEILSGGCVESFEALSSPISDKMSGIRVQLDTGELTITPDAFPYGVYVEFGGAKRGGPDYSLDQYRVLARPTPGGR